MGTVQKHAHAARATNQVPRVTREEIERRMPFATLARVTAWDSLCMR